MNVVWDKILTLVITTDEFNRLVPHTITTVQASTPRGFEIDAANEPNDPNLGSDRYYKIRNSVKNHVKRQDILDPLDTEFESTEENRSKTVVLHGLGGKKLPLSSSHRITC